MADGNIQGARVKLKRAVDRLIEKRPGVHYDVTVYQPSLYACLINDLGGGQGEDHSPGRSQPPCYMEAMQLVIDIENQVREWCPNPGNIPQRLQTLSWQTWRPQDCETVHNMARAVNGWCESIINLIDPEARKFVSAPCPLCTTKWVCRRDGAGDVVQQPALKWTSAAGFKCQACNESWAPDQALFFGRMLGFELPKGVLEN